jgi:hypothetical protein
MHGGWSFVTMGRHFEQHYTEGSSWDAIQVKDRLFRWRNFDSVEPGDEKFAIEFMFGCQTSMTGLFVTQLADLSWACHRIPATSLKQLYDQVAEHNMFACATDGWEQVNVV